MALLDLLEVGNWGYKPYSKWSFMGPYFKLVGAHLVGGFNVFFRTPKHERFGDSATDADAFQDGVIPPKISAD